jgi:hypothetical protein
MSAYADVVTLSGFSNFRDYRQYGQAPLSLADFGGFAEDDATGESFDWGGFLTGTANLITAGANTYTGITRTEAQTELARQQAQTAAMAQQSGAITQLTATQSAAKTQQMLILGGVAVAGLIAISMLLKKK